MAVVNFYKNQIDEDFQSFKIQEGKTVSSITKKLKLPDIIVYNQKTKTTERRRQTLDNCSIILNGVEVSPSYKVKKDDVISIYPRQHSKEIVGGVSSIIGGFGMILLGAAAGFATIATGGLGAFVVGGLILGGSLFAGSALIQSGSDLINSQIPKTKTFENGETSEALLSLRGGSNQSIVGQRFPFVFGTHLESPLVVGSPYFEITSKDGVGDIQTRKTLYAVGYAPLRVTDIKFGENVVAYNRDTEINGETLSRDTIFHGKLSGVTDNDDGQIVKKWKNNNVEIEILQGADFVQNQYGTIYPQVCNQKEVNSNVIYVYDKDLENTAQVIYKNTEFKGGFRTNTVKFSGSCPSRLEVELDFAGGLFGSDTYTDDSKSEPRYYKIPCNIAVQWRYVKNGQKSSNAESGSGWTSFQYQDNKPPVAYTAEMAKKDVEYNKGLTSGTSTNYNKEWIGCPVFQLGGYDSTSYTKGTVNINERRYVFSYDFSVEEAAVLTKEKEGASLDVVEVRVVRLTPMFLDETKATDSSSKFSNRAYQDLCKWTYLRTFSFDKEEFVNKYKAGTVRNLSEIPQRPLSQSDMKKLCLLAVSVQPDKSGNLSDETSVNLIASSLGPNLVEGNWVPKIEAQKKYWQKTLQKNKWITKELSQTEYLEKVQKKETGLYKTDSGNNFLDLVKTEIFTEENICDDNVSYKLNKEVQNKYITSNPAAIAALTVVGQHLGVDAKTLDSFDDSLTTFYLHCEDVTDGRPDEKSPDKLKHIKYCCDGILMQEKKLETFLSQVLFTGRAAMTVNSQGQNRIVIDKKRSYPEMVISQANCISRSFSRSFEDNPSGYESTFIDKEDGYNSSTLYAMADGEDYKNPSKEIVPFNIPYVVNKDHLWSLLRYILATSIMKKDVYTCTMGKVATLLSFGSYVLLKEDTLTLLSDKGSRIQKLIEDENKIYGFIINGVYEYTGALDNEGRCEKGITLVQPHLSGGSRCVTLRLCKPSGIITDVGETLVPTIGTSNVVLLETAIEKGNNGEFIDDNWVVLEPREGNLVEFGSIGSITKPALVTSVKKNDKGTFTVSLCSYDENVYEYGVELPVTQSPQIISDPSFEEFEIRNEVINTDLSEKTASIITEMTTQMGTRTTPDVPTNCTAIAEENYISLSCSMPNSWQKYNAINVIEWEVDKGDGFLLLTTSGTTDGRYYFLRDKTHSEYFEAETLRNWKLRARVTNVYKNTSEYSDVFYINTENYGTWKLTQAMLTSQSFDRQAILKLYTKERADGKKVFGNVRYKVVIQRIGNLDIQDIDPEVFVEADTSWYAPATSLSWQTSEDNYKEGEPVTGYADWSECGAVFVQTLPLLGQTKKRSVATEYRYKVIAYNEAGYSVESDVVSVTALPTNIVDIVHSNENYKDLYVQRLSAISANVGLISQGGFGSFSTKENYWALSDLFPSDTGLEQTIKKGSFRVGGKNQYIKVEPNGDDYNVSIKAGNLTFESDKTDVDGRLYAYDINDPQRKFRLVLSSNGIEFQKATLFDENGVGSVYTPQGQLRQSESGAFILTNADMNDESMPQERVIVGSDVSIHHFDENGLNTNNANPYSISTNGNIVSDESPVSSAVFSGKLEIPSTTPYKTAFFVKASCVEVGDQRLYPSGNIEKNLNKQASELSLGLAENVFKYV